MAGEDMTETQRTRLVELLTKTSGDVDAYLFTRTGTEPVEVSNLMDDHEALLTLVGEITGVRIDWDSGAIVTDKE